MEKALFQAVFLPKCINSTGILNLSFLGVEINLIRNKLSTAL